jgi:site-specific DNA-cytosine methylase
MVGQNGKKLIKENLDKAMTITARDYKGFSGRGSTGVRVDSPKQVGKTNTPGHDILKRVYSEDGKSPTITAHAGKGTVPKIETKPKQVGVAVDLKGHDIIKRVYSPEGKSPTINAHSGGNTEPKVVTGGAMRGRAYDEKGKRMDKDGVSVAEKTKQMLELRKDEKSNAITTVGKDSLVVSPIREKSKTVRSGGRGSYDRHEWDSVDEMHWRKLTPLECERLQTVPDGYTEGVSNTQRYRMLGNGWTVDVIAHILTKMEK